MCVFFFSSRIQKTVDNKLIIIINCASYETVFHRFVGTLIRYTIGRRHRGTRGVCDERPRGFDGRRARLLQSVNSNFVGFYGNR